MLAWQRLEGWHGGEILGDKLATERRFIVKTELESQGYR